MNKIITVIIGILLIAGVIGAVYSTCEDINENNLQSYSYNSADGTLTIGGTEKIDLIKKNRIDSRVYIFLIFLVAILAFTFLLNIYDREKYGQKITMGHDILEWLGSKTVEADDYSVLYFPKKSKLIVLEGKKCGKIAISISNLMSLAYPDLEIASPEMKSKITDAEYEFRKKPNIHISQVKKGKDDKAPDQIKIEIIPVMPEKIML